MESSINTDQFSLFFDLPLDKQEDILYRLDFRSIRKLCYIAILSKHPGAIDFSQIFVRGSVFWKRKLRKDFPKDHFKVLRTSLKIESTSEVLSKFWISSYGMLICDATEDLMAAVSRGDIGEVKRLVGIGVNPNCQNKEGYTALMEASYGGYMDIVLYLLKCGADIDAQDCYSSTALIEAAKRIHSNVVKILLDHGSDPNVSTNSGGTALMWAAYLGCIKTTELLLSCGALIDSESKCGYTALMQAAKWGRPDVLEKLLKCGADPNIQNKYHYTALVLASRKGYDDIVSMLLDYGADKYIRGPGNNDPIALELARRWGHSSIAEMLED